VTKSFKQLKTIFAQMDKRLSRAQKDIKHLRQVKKNFNILSKYYFGDWLKDRDRLLKYDLDANFKSLSEDAIWEVVKEWQKIK